MLTLQTVISMDILRMHISQVLNHGILITMITRYYLNTIKRYPSEIHIYIILGLTMSLPNGIVIGR